MKRHKYRGHTYKGDVALGARFPWGPIVATHQLGDYQFIEHLDRVFVNSCGTEQFKDTTSFSCYHKGRSLSMGASTLEGAIVSAIAYVRDGCNSQAARYFMRMIGGKKIRKHRVKKGK